MKSPSEAFKFIVRISCFFRTWYDITFFCGSSRFYVLSAGEYVRESYFQFFYEKFSREFPLTVPRLTVEDVVCRCVPGRRRGRLLFTPDRHGSDRGPRGGEELSDADKVQPEVSV